MRDVEFLDRPSDSLGQNTTTVEIRFGSQYDELLSAVAANKLGSSASIRYSLCHLTHNSSSRRYKLNRKPA